MMFRITEEGQVVLADYISQMTGTEFYMEMESEDSEMIKHLLMLQFGDKHGEYDFSRYQEWAEQFQNYEV